MSFILNFPMFQTEDSEPKRKAYKVEISEVPDMDGNGSTDLTDVKLLLKSSDHNVKAELKGNGDFHSPECVELLKQADMVVTNPPFSLFREYIALLPVYPTGEPNWQFMEDYIKSLPYSKNLEPSNPNEVVDELVEMKKEMIKMRRAMEAQQNASNFVNYGTININDNSHNFHIK